MPKKKVSQDKQFPKAQAVLLAALLDYSTEAIVSRALVQKETGSVTLFSFDIGQKLSEHTAPFDALVQILEGQAELTIGGQKVCPKAGECVLMPANIPHAVNAVERFKMLLTMIRS